MLQSYIWLKSSFLVVCFRSSNLLFRLPPPPFNHSQSENLFERLKVLAQLLRPRSSHAIRNPPVWLDMAFLPETGRHKLPSYITDILPPDWRAIAIDATDAASQVVIKALVVGPTEALDPTERRSGSRMRIKCGGQTDWLGWWWSVRLLSGCSLRDKTGARLFQRLFFRPKLSDILPNQFRDWSR